MKPSMDYDGTYYREIGDFLRENYLKYDFATGTGQEVAFLTELMNLPARSRILDVGCGPGRHALEFARRGYSTVGIDISPGFIKLAREKASKENLNAEFQVADARDLDFHREFDGAVCLCEGAFGIAGHEDQHRRILHGVYEALRPGAFFVLTAINALNLARSLTEETVFDAYTCTVMNRETITSPEGERKKVSLYTTAFTYRELKWLLEEAGFEGINGYACDPGNFGRHPLKADSMEIMMVARKKTE